MIMLGKTQFKLIGISLFWIVIFFTLTPIILFLTGNLISKSNIDITQKQDDVYFGIDEFSISDDLFSTVTVSGWAFAETNFTSSTKTAKLLFISDTDKYEVGLMLNGRRDLSHALKDISVPKDNQGFRGDFSPLGMKNGRYHVLLYVSENSKNWGIVNTGRIFTKENRKFFEVLGGETLSNDLFLQLDSTDKIKSGIDICNIISNQVIISGWAFRDNTEAGNDEVFLLIRKPDHSLAYFSTDKKPRYDIRKIFGNDLYYLSGFYSELPVSVFDYGENFVTIIINKKYLSTTEYVCRISRLP